MADLTGVRAKFDRACRHAEAFQAAADEVLGTDPYFVSYQREADGWHVLRWQVKGRPDLSPFPLIFGDMLTNLRATLDYLVWQLVLANDQTPTDRTAFPVVKNAANWASAAGDRLKGVDPTWIEEVRGLQPFNGSDGGPPQRHMLAVLDSVNNLNKHRLMSPVMAALDVLQLRVEFAPDSPEAQMTHHMSTAPIEQGAEAFRIRSDPAVDFKVHVDAYPAVRVTFRDGMDHSDGWGYTNGELVDWVRRAITVFEPAFAS